MNDQYMKEVKLLDDIVFSAILTMDRTDSIGDIAKLEAFARAFCGAAPFWNVNAEYPQLCTINYGFLHKGIKLIQRIMQTGQVTNPQCLIEAGYIALGFLRCQIAFNYIGQWYTDILILFFEECLNIPIRNNNWILFPSMLETFNHVFHNTKSYQYTQLSLQQLETWYKGDGIYGDGEHLQLDYYNSYVLHPFIFTIVNVWKSKIDFGYDIYRQRVDRYAEYLESIISPEGTFPVMGRSSVYRFAAFAHLSDYITWNYTLPFAKQARSAISAVLNRYIDTKNLFDKQLLTVGLLGENNLVKDYYITEGSVHICALGLSHLARPELYEDDVEWTQKKIWSNQVIPYLSQSIKV